ncbi:hypothetical protein MTR_8g020740 [Medicago truncatula]|uniref:Uncharacterized protein n=1 Tax=Medicago truncatula TaxID=3880 RepID=G7L6V8_MEDTR|nr:hypothetical protein MTR_8g020740 [Medicago truncatula]
MSTDTSTKDNYETYCNGGKFPPPSLPTSRGMLPLCRCLPMKPMILYIATTLENQGRRFWRVAIGRIRTQDIKQREENREKYKKAEKGDYSPPTRHGKQQRRAIPECNKDHTPPTRNGE